MELMGEIYARGAGVERNYTKAFEWLSLAAKQQYYSAYNGLGYLYVKGYGVEEKNLTKVCHFVNYYEGSSNLYFVYKILVCRYYLCSLICWKTS